MYRQIKNALRGSVELAVESAMPERVLNLCAARGIPFWAVEWVDDLHLRLRSTRRGAAELAEAAEKLGARITRGGERGVPVLARRLRRRYVLFGAMALFLAAAWYGGSFVWSFTVEGNETVPEKVILRALERQGITAGIRTGDIDQDVLRNRILLELPELSWLAVNVRGCCAHVQVVERRDPGPLVRDDDYTHVTASRDALVTKVEALRGQACIKPGDTVQRGEMLISGVVDGAWGGVYRVHGCGRVYGRTWYTLTLTEPLTCEKKSPGGQKRTVHWLTWGKKAIKIPPGGSAWQENCDKITLYRELSLPFGISLPAAWVSETFTKKDTLTVSRSAAQAQKAAEAELLRRLAGEMTPEGEIRKTQFTAAQRGNTLQVTLTAECYEQIGQLVSAG